jgi:hypothetical protein
MLDHIALLDMLLAFFQAVTGETGVKAQASHAGPSHGVLPAGRWRQRLHNRQKQGEAGVQAQAGSR